MIAIVGARSLTIREQPTGVVVVASAGLVRWLQRRPATFSVDEVHQMHQAAASSSTWGSAPMPVADLAGFATLRSAVVQAKRRRLLWAVGLLLGPIGLLMAAFMGSVLGGFGVLLN
jgi:hypothetical protein